jgi:hypothetical protein
MVLQLVLAGASDALDVSLWHHASIAYYYVVVNCINKAATVSSFSLGITIAFG